MVGKSYQTKITKHKNQITNKSLPINRLLQNTPNVISNGVRNLITSIIIDFSLKDPQNDRKNTRATPCESGCDLLFVIFNTNINLPR